MSKSENEVRVEKIFNKPAKTVFQALAEGRLFNTCGAVMGQLEIDFRKGGKYKASFPNADAKLCGKFLEIVPDKKIRFTWGDEGSDTGFPLTEVSIELFTDGEKTKLVILHTGFITKEDAESHNTGWNAGLDDLNAELVQGRIRIIRVYPVSKDKLYEACSDPKTFFGLVSDVSKGEVDFRVGGQYRFPTKKGEIRGKFEEIIPGQKIVFSWLSGCDGPFDHPTRVTLLFDDEDEGASSVALTHELLPTDAVKTHREGWEFLTQGLYAVLK
jgi:uncharacterized protein YndB with AHSA1/START domain